MKRNKNSHFNNSKLRRRLHYNLNDSLYKENTEKLDRDFDFGEYLHNFIENNNSFFDEVVFDNTKDVMRIVIENLTDEYENQIKEVIKSKCPYPTVCVLKYLVKTAKIPSETYLSVDEIFLGKIEEYLNKGEVLVTVIGDTITKLEAVT